MARSSAASFQSAQFSVAPARESDHGDANEFSQFSVSPAFSRASAGVRSRRCKWVQPVFSQPSFQSRQRGSQITACRDWRSKNEPEASSLAEGCFFESHIRATNAPARRSSILTIMLIMSKNTLLTRSLPLSSPCGLPSAVYLYQLIRRISRPAPPSELPCGSLWLASSTMLRPSGQPSVSLSSALPSLRFSTFPKGLDSVHPVNPVNPVHPV